MMYLNIIYCSKYPVSVERRFDMEVKVDVSSEVMTKNVFSGCGEQKQLL